MTVTKYRTFEEAERALWEFNPDGDYFRKAAAMFELMGKIQANMGTSEYGDVLK